MANPRRLALGQQHRSCDGAFAPPSVHRRDKRKHDAMPNSVLDHIEWVGETEWVVPPRQARSRKTLQKILTAALTLFKEKGYEETTIADISSQCGFSVGAIYKRFNAKE